MSSPSLRRSLVLALSTALLAPAGTFAAVSWRDVQFGGFLSQGYLESTNNNYPVETRDGTFEFHEIALNASAPFGSHLRVSTQVFAQSLGKYGEDKPVLDYAILDYNFRPELGVQVGRLKYPRSLYSDVLDLDMLRPFVFLPQSVYEARLRDFQAFFDGAMIYGTAAAGAGSIDYKVFYGDIPIKNGSFTSDFFNSTGTFGPSGPTSLGLDSVGGAALVWNTPISGLRCSLTYSRITHLFAQGPLALMPALPVKIEIDPSHIVCGSFEYARDRWTFAAEYLYNTSDLTVTMPPPLPAIPTMKYGSHNYYVSVARRLGEKFEVGACFSETRDLDPATAGGALLHRRDWTAAIRYDLNDHLLFKVEAHAIDGTKDIFDSPGIPNPAGSIKNSMNLFAAKTTFTF